MANKKTNSSPRPARETRTQKVESVTMKLKKKAPTTNKLSNINRTQVKVLKTVGNPNGTLKIFAYKLPRDKWLETALKSAGFCDKEA